MLHFIPCHIGIDPVAGIVVQDQPATCWKFWRGKVQRGSAVSESSPTAGQTGLAMMAGQGLPAIQPQPAGAGGQAVIPFCFQRYTQGLELTGRALSGANSTASL